MNSPRSLSRRSFLKGTVLAGAGLAVAPHLLLSSPGQAKPGRRVNLALCGIGNRGAELARAFEATGIANVVALCDTDMGAPHTLEVMGRYPSAPRFQDFRKMFDQVGSGIDAVCVGTPDFSHFPIAMLAMSLGKHVYCEKPMGQSFRQIALMMAAEKKYGVVTQMGNQGHSEANYFQFKTWTEAGLLRNVTKITAFMNNPRRWHGKSFSAKLPEQPVPATLDWDLWTATAPTHPYNVGYINGEWRSWYDLGNGALGDWGAHIFDTAHEFLELGLPTEIEPLFLDGHSAWIFPQASTLAFRFPARGARPPVELTWYDGQKNLPPLPQNFGTPVLDPGIPPPSTGDLQVKKFPPGKVIYAGDLTFKGGSHATTLELLDSPAARDLAGKLPSVPRSPSNHYKNFLLSCLGEEKPRSPFAVAGPLCQAMALGIIAQRVNAKLVFDPATQRITNHAVANEFLAGNPPRPGWEQFYRLA